MTKLIKHHDIDQDKIVTINDWALTTLSEEEFKEFKQAEERNTNLMLTYQKAGLISINSIEQKFFSSILNEEVSIITGLEVTLSPGVTIMDIPIDPEWGMWEARYAADSNVNYSPMYQD